MGPIASEAVIKYKKKKNFPAYFLMYSPLYFPFHMYFCDSSSNWTKDPLSLLRLNETDGDFCDKRTFISEMG
ncbi:hypothetical protein D3C75_966710 [compost metagenome]